MCVVLVIVNAPTPFQDRFSANRWCDALKSTESASCATWARPLRSLSLLVSVETTGSESSLRLFTNWPTILPCDVLTVRTGWAKKTRNWTKWTYNWRTKSEKCKTIDRMIRVKIPISQKKRKPLSRGFLVLVRSFTCCVFEVLWFRQDSEHHCWIALDIKISTFPLLVDCLWQELVWWKRLV